MIRGVGKRWVNVHTTPVSCPSGYLFHLRSNLGIYRYGERSFPNGDNPKWVNASRPPRLSRSVNAPSGDVLCSWQPQARKKRERENEEKEEGGGQRNSGPEGKDAEGRGWWRGGEAVAMGMKLGREYEYGKIHLRNIAEEPCMKTGCLKPGMKVIYHGYLKDSKMIFIRRTYGPHAKWFFELTDGSIVYLTSHEVNTRTSSADKT